MKIVHVITRLIVGGAQENTVLTCRGLAEAGHEVTLIAGTETGPEGSLWPQAETCGCRIIRANALRRAIRPRIDLRAIGALAHVFGDLRPDIVHTHSSKAGIVGREAARRAGVPVIIHTIHGMSFNRTQPWWLRAAYRLLERRAGRFTTAFVTVAEAMTDQAVAAGLGPRSKFTTVRSGMVVDQFGPDEPMRAQVRGAWGVSESDVVVGTIARLFENKGYEQIIGAMPEAVRRAPRLRFVWVGAGAHRGAYERQVDALGLRDRVRFLGLVPPDEVGRQIKGFDMVLHASRWEGLPRAVVQGLLTEVPAVSFDNDGASEVVIDNETGKLVPYGDIDGLTRAIVELAEQPDLRRRLGARGRELCREEFDWRKMVADLEALYERLM